MDLGLLIAAQMQPDGAMAATLRQHHRLRIGPFAVLMATADKGQVVGSGIGQVEPAAIQGQEPMSLVEGPRRLRRTQQMRSLLKELLERLDAQDLPLITQSRGSRWLLGGSGIAVLEPMSQLLPDPCLRQTAPENHRQHKPQHAQGREVPQSSRFLLPFRTLLAAR